MKDLNITNEKIIEHLKKLQENLDTTKWHLESFLKENDRTGIIQMCEILLRMDKEKSAIESMIYAQGIEL